MHILVVDDDPEALDSLVRMLEADKRDVVVTACDGLEAWEILSDPECTINLCFVDLVMPEMSGMELISRMRRSPGHDRTPVVLYTGIQDRRVVEKAASMRIAGYLGKPADEERLFTIVEKAREFVAALPSASPTAPLPLEQREPQRQNSQRSSFAPAARTGRVPLLEESAVVCKRLGVDAMMHVILLRFTVAGVREWVDASRRDLFPSDPKEAADRAGDLVEVCDSVGLTGPIPDIESVRTCLTTPNPSDGSIRVNDKFLDNVEETLRKVLDRIGDVALDTSGAKLLMLPVRRLRPGQRTVTPIFSKSGLVLLAPDSELTPAILQRLGGFAEGKDVREPVFVRPSLQELAAQYT